MSRYVAKRGRYSASGDYSRHSGHAQTPTNADSDCAPNALRDNEDELTTTRVGQLGNRLMLGTLERIVARAGGCVNRFRVLLNLYEQQHACLKQPNSAPLGTLRLAAKPGAVRLPLALYSTQTGATLCALTALTAFDHFPLEHLLTRMSFALTARPRASVTVNLQRNGAPLLSSAEFDIELAVRLPPRSLLFTRAQSAALEALLTRTELHVPRVRVHEPTLKPAVWACRGDARALNNSDASFAGVAGLTALQLSALAWMTWRESSDGPTLHEASTRRFAFHSGGALESDVLSRHFVLRAADDQPSTTRGGVLALDAGIGGRVDIFIALVARDADSGALQPSKRTLIVVSAETLDYWTSALRASLGHRVPWSVCRRRGGFSSNRGALDALLAKPVLLTTYGALAANQATLTRVDWHRVAFDCVAALKPGESARDIVLRKLRAANRWVLAPNASRAFTLVGSRRPMRTIARALLPHNREWISTLAADEDEEAQGGERDVGWGVAARALFLFQASGGGQAFVTQSIEPLLFDASDDERRVLQAVQQRKVALLTHRARRMHSNANEAEIDDSDDSDENDQQLSVLQVLHEVTSVTAQPRQALTCTCDEDLLQRVRRREEGESLAAAAVVESDQPLQQTNGAEQEFQWNEAIDERHGQCAICLDEPSDLILTRCTASPSSDNESDDDASMAEEQEEEEEEAEEEAAEEEAGQASLLLTETTNGCDANQCRSDAVSNQNNAVARHLFCFRCLAAALHRQTVHEERKTCPMCRASLRQSSSMIRLQRVAVQNEQLTTWKRVPLQLSLYQHMRLQHGTRNDLDDMDDAALQQSIQSIVCTPLANLSRTRALCSFVAQRPRGSVLIITRFEKQIEPLQSALSRALNCASECVFADTLFAARRQATQRGGDSELCPAAYVLSEQKLSMLDGVHLPESVNTLVVCQALTLFDPVTVDRLKLLLSAPRRASAPVTVRCLAARDSAEAIACDVALPLVFQMPPCQSPAGCCEPQHAQTSSCDNETRCNFSARSDSSVENHMDTFEELLSTLHQRLTGVPLSAMPEPEVDEDFFSTDDDDDDEATNSAEEDADDSEAEEHDSSASDSSSLSSSDGESLDDNDL